MADHQRQPARCLNCDARLFRRYSPTFSFCGLVCATAFRSQAREMLYGHPQGRPSAAPPPRRVPR